MLVHGGAGDIPDSRDTSKLSGCKAAAKEGYRVLTSAGGSVVDTVEAAVAYMELDDNFNCGYGSVLTLNGTVEMEASIMDGATMVFLFFDVSCSLVLLRSILESGLCDANQGYHASHFDCSSRDGQDAA